MPTVLHSKIISNRRDSRPSELSPGHCEPENGQFLLQVDRQTKASFQTFEAAEVAGQQIKRGHPVVRVTVLDSADHTNRTIELPKG